MRAHIIPFAPINIQTGSIVEDKHLHNKNQKENQKFTNTQ